MNFNGLYERAVDILVKIARKSLADGDISAGN
jgi:hypothetical protein